jgi:hypothetical protein
MAEKERGPDRTERHRRHEIEDDDVQGHRFSEDLTGGDDDVAGHVQTTDEEQEETPPESRG